MTGKPKVELAFRDVLCALHGEPLREEWPKGYGQIYTFLFGPFAALESVIVYTREGAHNLAEAAKEFGPLCCAVSAETMLKAYRRAGIGDFGRCEICATIRRGTPYRMIEGSGLRLLAHVCFECVVRKMKPEGLGPPV